MHDAHRCVHVHDHLAPGLVALPVVSSFLFLLQHAIPGRSVLQSELAEDFAEAVDADLPHAVGWVTQVQQEGVEPDQRKVTQPAIIYNNECRRTHQSGYKSKLQCMLLWVIDQHKVMHHYDRRRKC